MECEEEEAFKRAGQSEVLMEFKQVDKVKPYSTASARQTASSLDELRK